MLSEGGQGKGTRAFPLLYLAFPTFFEVLTLGAMGSSVPTRQHAIL